MQKDSNKLMSKSHPKIKVFIADDHGIMREALRNFLNQQAEFEVVGEAASSEEVVENCQALMPDVVIMDISMPIFDGVQCASRLRRICPDSRIIFLTSHDSAQYLKECILIGAHAYVLKRSLSDDLKLAIITTSRGGMYIDPAMASRLRALLDLSKDAEGPPAVLSEREVQVIALIAKGYSLKDVSTKLKISVKTVETYKARSLEKLNLRSRAELVRHALENGWLSKII
jgi:two-component system, NarL family, response regulator NreC